MVPPRGFEPRAIRLQGGSSTAGAMAASFGHKKPGQVAGFRMKQRKLRSSAGTGAFGLREHRHPHSCSRKNLRRYAREGHHRALHQARFAPSHPVSPARCLLHRPYQAFFLHLLRKTISKFQDFFTGETNLRFRRNQITTVTVTDQTRCERLPTTICFGKKASDQLPHFHELDPRGPCTKKPDTCRASFSQSLMRRNDRMGLISLIRSLSSTKNRTGLSPIKL